MAKAKIGNREAGSGISKGHSGKSEASIRDLLLAIRAELDDLRTKYGTLLAKLDADAGVTDTNYATTQALAAPTFEK